MYEEILASPAYHDLSLAAKALLTEFQRIYRKWRNGQLSISTKQATELMGVAEKTTLKAFDELQSHGFLIMTKGEQWQSRKAREFRLTIETYGNNLEPTDEWKTWSAESPLPVPAGKGKKTRP